MRSFWILVLYTLAVGLPLIVSLELSKPDQIIEVFRHGARGPFIGFDRSWPKEQKGQLTPAGMHQHYVLGRTLSKKYSHIFNESTSASDVYILANRNPRCIQSAFFQRSGLYNKRIADIVPENLKSAAVPPFQDPVVREISLADEEVNRNMSVTRFLPQVNVVSDEKASLFKRARRPLCPNGALWERENHNDEKAMEAWRIFNETIENVKKNLPRSIRLKNAFDVPIIGDALLVNEFHKKSTVPLGIPDDNPELLRNFTYAYSWFTLHIEYGQEKQRQLTAYKFVTEILDQLKAFRKGDRDSKKAALYSGHDYNIYSILSAFGAVTEECIMANFLSSVANETLPYPNCYFPIYASNLLFEMYNTTDKEAYVKLLYNNQVIPICHGKEVCEFEEFVQFAESAIGNHTLQSFKSSCGKKTKKDHHIEEEEENLEDALMVEKDESPKEEIKEEFEEEEENFSNNRKRSKRAYSSEDFKEVKGKRVGKKMRLKSIIITTWICLGVLIFLALKFKDQSKRFLTWITKDLIHFNFKKVKLD